MSHAPFNRQTLVLLSLCLAACCLPAFGQNSLPESAARQIRALLAEKATRNPAQLKLDSQIHYAAKVNRGRPIADGVPTLPTIGSSLELRNGGLVHVDISAHVNPDLLAAIGALGGRVESSFVQYNAIRAWLPLSAMETLAARPDVMFIRPAARLFVNTGPDVNGVKAHAADIIQAKGYLGAGVRIGVMSNGVNSLAAEQAAGRLPSTVTVISGQQGSGDEGTAMLEIVYSMAPSAQLYFATGNGGDAQMASNILALYAAGCQIIVDDLTYSDEPVFQDGTIAQAVNSVTASGVLYFSSAQNSGNLDSHTSGTWEGDFVNSGTSIGPIPESGTINSFGSTNNDAITTVSGLGEYIVQWSDPWGASCNDYDVFILNSTLTSVLASLTNPQSCTQNPIESLSSSTIPAGSRIVIVDYQGNAAARAIHVDTERGQLSINTSGATFGHNAAAAAITVAAASVATTGGGAFTGGTANPPESFSSDGPRKIFYSPNGSPITPNNFLFSTSGGTTLSKVDITAADGVTTGVSGFTTFFGTSAAAPHAAGIAALVISANPYLTASQVKSAMLSSALPVSNYNSRTVGSGITMATGSITLGTAPVVTSISPNPVYVNQNVTLTVNGTSFQSGFSAAITSLAGNITPTGLTYISPTQVQMQVTMPVASSTYTATLTITNPGGESGSGTFQVLVSIPVSGTLTANTTWNQVGVPYVVANGGVTVPFGTILTISPGVVVKFVPPGQYTNSSYLLVQGTLTANGTSTQSIIFTSYLDDTADGDTNGDGGATTPSAGNWAGIRFDPLSSGSLTYATVRYGGGSAYSGPSYAAVDVATDTTAPTLSNNLIEYSLTGMAVSGAVTNITVTQTTFLQNSTGLAVNGGSATVNGSTFTSNTSIAVSAGSGAGGSITNNTITTTTGGSAFSIGASFLGSITGNTVSGTGLNGLVVAVGTLSGNVTWSQLGIAYVVGNGGVTVPVGSKLTILPGVVVKFVPPGQYSNSSYLLVQGTLTANGTSTQPIIFTSYLDDTADGDTNGDGGAATPSPGNWAGIRFDPLSIGSLTYATVRFGGGSAYSGPSYAAVDVGTNTTAPTLSNNLIEYSVTGMAISGAVTNVTVMQTTFLQNSTGLAINGGSATINGSTFTKNTSTAVSAASGAGGIITGNTITTTTGGSAFSIGTSFLGSISGNTVSGTGLNGLVVGVGTLSGNVTWSQLGIAYVVGNGGLTVPTGSKLTISPGVVVKFVPPGSYSNSSYLLVQGTLVANGTSTQSIIFTSYLDDTADGDTNEDGGATTPSPGNWAGIRFDPLSIGSLTYATVRYGGGSAYSGPSYAAVDLGTNTTAPSLSSNLIEYNVTGMAVSGATTNVTVTKNVFQQNATGLAVNSGKATIKSCTFKNNTTTAINAGNGAGGTITGNTIVTTTGGSAFSVNAGFLGGISANKVSGTGLNGLMVVGSTLNGSVTWSQLGIAYVVGNGGVTVPPGSKLTISPGVVVKFVPPGSYSNSSYLLVQGTLAATGTTTQSIVFTSYLDDTADGDTNGDGGATTPSPGNWAGIRFDPLSSGSLTYATVRYGGGSAYSGPSYAAVDVATDTTAPTLSNNLIEYSVTGMAISGAVTNVTLTQTTFQQNSTGLAINGGSATVNGSTFTNNTSTAISAAAGTGGSISANTITTTAGGSAFSINAGFLGSISGNTATGSGLNGVTVGGTANGNITWSQLGIAYVVTNGGVTVPPGSKLTISPGVVIKFEPPGSYSNSSYLLVQGTLTANGTSTQPIIFTSYLDDTADGDTNGDGGATTPSPGNWAGIRFDPLSSGSLTYATVRFGGGSAYSGPSYAAVDVATYTTAPTLNNNVITSNVTGIAISNPGTNLAVTLTKFNSNGTAVHIYNDAEPTINNNTISGNSFGVQNDDPIFPTNATNNYWGASNGPSGAGSGSGDKVSTGVNFVPFLTSPPV